MRTLVRWIAIATFCGIAACGDSTPATPPTAPTPAPPQPVSLLRTTLTPGEVSFTGPGQSTRVTVMAIFSDGVARDITSDINWQIDKPEVASIEGGLLTARGYGTTRFFSEYQGKFVGPGYAYIRVPADLLMPLTGVVHDQYNRPVAGARLTATGAVDSAATTDASGAFDLGPTYGTMRLTLTKFGHETSDRTVQVAGMPLRAHLVLPESPSPYVERAFEVQGSSIWQTHRLDTRAGGPLDVMVESLACDYRRAIGVLTVRLRGGGAPLGDESVGCSVRVTQTMTADEGQLEVTISTPGTYRVTSRVPR